MKNAKLLLPVALAAGCGVLLTAGCDSTTKRKWLTTFFDGVPPPHSATNATMTGVAATNTAAGSESGSKAVAVVAKEPFYYGHPPFVQQKCAECHESGLGMGMKKKTPDLCFDCHKDFLTTAKVKHQPVESGDCNSCHDPHQSDKNKQLLLKTGKDLCFDCHDNFLDKAKVKHQPAENGECLACHNPHATDRKKLVTKSSPTLCWDCHDNFLEKAKFKHDVVEDCTACHNPHQSAESKLLLKNPAKLCFECHEESDLKKVQAHAHTEDKSCLECHDPHISQEKNLLKPGKQSVSAPAN
jgi:predicted CXXCH cytochrome family protein